VTLRLISFEMLRRVDWLMVADVLEAPSKRRQLFSNQNDDTSQKTSFNLHQHHCQNSLICQQLASHHSVL